MARSRVRSIAEHHEHGKVIFFFRSIDPAASPRLGGEVASMAEGHAPMLQTMTSAPTANLPKKIFRGVGEERLCLYISV